MYICDISLPPLPRFPPPSLNPPHNVGYFHPAHVRFLELVALERRDSNLCRQYEHVDLQEALFRNVSFLGVGYSTVVICLEGFMDLEFGSDEAHNP